MTTKLLGLTSCEMHVNMGTLQVHLWSWILPDRPHRFAARTTCNGLAPEIALVTISARPWVLHLVSRLMCVRCILICPKFRAQNCSHSYHFLLQRLWKFHSGKRKWEKSFTRKNNLYQNNTFWVHAVFLRCLKHLYVTLALKHIS